jgi:hypothetical protein
MKRWLVPVCAATAMAGLAAPLAHANGDPASDVLPFKTVFLSNQEPNSSTAGRELLALTTETVHKKLPIRVAVIYQQSDLGLIQSLWRKPRTYANFLGKELVAFGRYHGTLLVAMPEGFAVFGPGATPKAKQRLAGLPQPGSGSLDDLGYAAADATRAVAAANDVKLTTPRSRSGGTSGLVIILAVLGGAAVIAGVAFVVLRRWLTRPSAA